MPNPCTHCFRVLKAERKKNLPTHDADIQGVVFVHELTHVFGGQGLEDFVMAGWQGQLTLLGDFYPLGFPEEDYQ